MNRSGTAASPTFTSTTVGAEHKPDDLSAGVPTVMSQRYPYRWDRVDEYMPGNDEYGENNDVCRPPVENNQDDGSDLNYQTAADEEITSLLGLLTVFDSSLPVGSFTKSNGYEAARKLGYLYDETSFLFFCESALENAAAINLPVIAAIYTCVHEATSRLRCGRCGRRRFWKQAALLFDQLVDLSARLRATLVCNEVEFNASESQGVAFLSLAARMGIFHTFSVPREENSSNDLPDQNEHSDNNIILARRHHKTKQCHCCPKPVFFASSSNAPKNLNNSSDQCRQRADPKTNLCPTHCSDTYQSIAASLARAAVYYWAMICESSPGGFLELLLRNRSGNCTLHRCRLSAGGNNEVEGPRKTAIDRGGRLAIEERIKLEDFTALLQPRLLFDSYTPQYVVVLTLVCISLQIRKKWAMTAFLQSFLRTVIAASVRDNFLGPTAGQYVFANQLQLWNQKTRRTASCPVQLRTLVAMYCRSPSTDTQSKSNNGTQCVLEQEPPDDGSNDSNDTVSMGIPPRKSFHESYNRSVLIEVIQASHKLLFSRNFQT